MVLKHVCMHSSEENYRKPLKSLKDFYHVIAYDRKWCNYFCLLLPFASILVVALSSFFEVGFVTLSDQITFSFLPPRRFFILISEFLGSKFEVLFWQLLSWIWLICDCRKGCVSVCVDECMSHLLTADCLWSSLQALIQWDKFQSNLQFDVL